LVFGITVEDHLVYASPITASHFDSRALSEVNNACLQLGFQGVLGRVNDLVLWLEEGEGDEKEISQQTGLNVTREPFPEWPAPQGKPCPLMPADVRAMTHHREAVGRVRLLALSGGLVLAALVAVMMVLISVALKERNGLREKVAELTPRAARVEDQRASWEEAAPAVDPSRGPMQMLLHLMEPSVSADVTLMDFEFTPDRVLLRGHTKSASQALQYQQEIQQGESLMA
ncbi:MAG: hypothetical protein KDK99_02680, partial [Verrucomicrobiales bacterium]|nr:hypothetical protein [Verrucomicrobiales bacterium]